MIKIQSLQGIQLELYEDQKNKYLIGYCSGNIERLFIPKDNLNDIEWLEKDLKNDIEFIPVSNYLEIYEKIFS